MNGSDGSNVSAVVRRVLFEDQNANNIPIGNDWLLTFRASCTLIIIIKTVQILKLLYVYRQVGVLLTALLSMMQSVKRVVVLYVVIFIGASIAYGVLSADRDQTDITSTFGGYYIPFFSFMGLLESDVLEYTPVAIFHFIYTGAIDIIILNLVIAIMTDRYFRSSLSGAAAVKRLDRHAECCLVCLTMLR